MKRHHKTALLLLALAAGNNSFAQDSERVSGSIYLQPADKADVTIPFDINGEGHRFEPTWGLDQAWISEQNMRKGLNHMGKENVGIGRTAFRMTVPLKDGALQGDLVQRMRERSRILALADEHLPVVLTADQEAGTDESYVKNRSANVENWAALINASVQWIKDNTSLSVTGVSPFNEPDYWTVEEGATPAKHRDVAKLLKENYSNFANNRIAIVGGNTLNNDKAWEWYNAGKEYYDWGNTHQLAGYFNTFAEFFQKVSNEGKVAYADEMHNVGEAMIGLEYGMTVGIWWGYDSRARGEFCQISRHGERLAYGEHRDNWTAGSVYRHDDGRVKAFLGSSERQAKNTNFQLVSTERDVYYDGYGPVRELLMQMPGGNGYQNGQTNAERVIDVTWGADVPPMQITEGQYRIFNKATTYVVNVAGNSILQQKPITNAKAQQWTIKPISPRIGGDYSFYNFESVSNASTHINVRDFSTFDGAEIIAYSQNSTPSSNEQWYLEYAGDGYYYIRNRESALYLTTYSSAKVAGVKIIQRTLQTDDTADRQLWRILPVDIDYETDAPAQPTGLVGESNVASVKLSWEANSEQDLDGYMVLRSPADREEWNTIARRIQTNHYTDNTCMQGVSYIYKVKAIDKAQNQSEPSETVSATPSGAKGLVANWLFEDNLQDNTNNMMDAVSKGSLLYMTDHKQGEKSLRTTNSSYVQLPYEVANSDELTIALWVKWSNSSNWQRIFDFGNGTDNYMFLTPMNSYTGKMRFAIKNGGDEQTIDCDNRLTLNQWKHIAVSIGKDKTTIYIDGEEAASSTDITISPSELHPVLNYIGRSQFSADPYFTGYIDDVRIYNYALNNDEVKEAMEGNTDGIANIDKNKPTEESAKAYDLGGRKVTNTQGVARHGGITIVNGRKTIGR